MSRSGASAATTLTRDGLDETLRLSQQFWQQWLKADAFGTDHQLQQTTVDKE